MQNAPGSRGFVAGRPAARHAAVRALAGALALGFLAAACGLKGPLTLPEKTHNVVIRPGPGEEAAPAPAPVPAEVEPLPPPELPPDTRGNTRD
jgi:predicted small lipoprotein YifL